MAARQGVSLEQPARAVHDESAPPTKRYLEALQKVQRTLQVPGREPSLRGEILARDALPTLLPAWEDLCERSAEDNVYYSPRYAQALLHSVERKQNVRFAIVWDDSRLVAMLPFTSPKFAVPVLRAAGQAWQSKYTFSCTPLLDKNLKTEAAEALLNVLGSISESEWIIPRVNTAGEACLSMVAALVRRSAPWEFLNPFRRATLEVGATFDEHMNTRVCSKRRKGLARNRRRLEELGKVEHESHSCGEGLERAVSVFLEIEASGWKGKRGTALACNEKTLQFARNAFTGEEISSICRADVLTVGGVPIAVSLIALAGRTGFAVKACYDEFYRSYSPGLLLETEVIRSFLAENWASRLDAATTTETHVLESLWPGRVEVADLMFSLSPRHSALRLSALKMSNRTSENIRTGLKRLMRRGAH
jgi:CelD/BcsL family acetyltransferase involved in cellulose biosynthesis